jgi:cyclophilin family peptidyl-prolyl cis-trans isomerase
VGTEKRERQKANRALRQQEQQRAQTRRRGLRIGLVVVGAVVAIFAVVWVGGRFAGSDDGSSDAVTDTGADGAFSTGDLDASGDSATSDTLVTDTGPPDTEPVVLADPADCPPTDGSGEAQSSFAAPPPMCLDPDVVYDAVVTTNMGEFTIELDQDQAPNTVNNFVFLARNLYYDDTLCHRIIPDFVVQCGDPTATGTGGPGYEFDDELPEEGEYQTGSVAMANSGPNTNGSQFFIVTGDQGAALPPSYSLFGQVTEGFDSTVLAMEAAGSAGGTPTEDVEIISIEIVER